MCEDGIANGTVGVLTASIRSFAQNKKPPKWLLVSGLSLPTR